MIKNEDFDVGGRIVKPSPLKIFVESFSFNAFIGLIIIINMVFIGLENDFGSSGGTDGSCPTPSQLIQANLPWFIADNIFTGIFVIELLMRLIVYRLQYFAILFNVFDTLIVISGVVDTWILTFADPCQGGDIRILLALRIVRTMRLTRFIRLLKIFKELWLIVAGLANSVKTLFWVAILLIFILYVCSVFLTTEIGQNQFLFIDPSYDGSIFPVDVYFGSVAKSMVTLWQITTLDSWCDSIVRHVVYRQPGMAIFFVLYILFTTFGLLNIIVGVIVENTIGMATVHEEQEDRLKDQERKAALEAIRKVFELSDVDKSGTLTKSEFRASCQLKEVREKIDIIGVDPQDVEAMFGLMDPTGNNEIKLGDFMASCVQLTGSAQQKDVMQVLIVVEGLTKKMDSLGKKLSSVEANVYGLLQSTRDFANGTLGDLTGRHDTVN